MREERLALQSVFCSAFPSSAFGTFSQWEKER